MTWVKVCGCTSASDVRAAVDAGADAVGFVFAPSPRRIEVCDVREIASELPERLDAVGVFVDPRDEEIASALAAIGRMRVQFAGDEPPEQVAAYGERAIKVVHVREAQPADDLRRVAERYPSALLLFDTAHARLAGGTGRTFDWCSVAGIARERPAVIAGGLTPENVATCVRSARPFGVDVRSGVERDGCKDPQRMRAFVHAVRAIDAA